MQGVLERAHGLVQVPALQQAAQVLPQRLPLPWKRLDVRLACMTFPQAAIKSSTYGPCLVAMIFMSGTRS